LLSILRSQSMKCTALSAGSPTINPFEPGKQRDVNLLTFE
jgi:urease beta subunit